MKTGRVLIIDDDENLRESLASILRANGLDVAYATNGYEALTLAKTVAPEVILLDVWLPGIDGVAILQALQALQTESMVIVMSGHGDIAIAIQVMRLGAFEYLEKPFSLKRVLSVVDSALQSRREQHPKGLPGQISTASAPLTDVSSQPHVLEGGLPWSGKRAEVSRCEPSQASKHTNPMGGHVLSSHWQRTLRRSTVLYGQGLQSGLKTGLILAPLPPDSGIIFRNITTGKTIPASIDCIESTDFCTSLRYHCVAAKTVEHLMSALHAYRLTNILVNISDEIPIMDGSAVAFCHLIEDAGVVEQDVMVEDFVVDRCYAIGQVRTDAKFILVEPYDGFRVTYRLRYPKPLGIQEYTYEHTDGRGYLREIAPARTFGFVKDVEKMHELGLIEGGRLTNVVLIGDDNVVNSAPLRFPDECVRHKILDIMGDFYLLGRSLRGHIHANMTGHTENIALIKQLHAAILASPQ